MRHAPLWWPGHQTEKRLESVTEQSTTAKAMIYFGRRRRTGNSVGPNSTSGCSMTDAAMIPAPSKASLWEDFIDIFYQPAAVFDRRREGKFGLALVVLVVVCAVLYLALRNGLAPIMDAEMAKATAAMSAKNANLTSEQISSMTGTMEKFAVIGYVVFLPIGVLLTGAILWAVSRLVDAKAVSYTHLRAHE